jgi:S1-C subfamily serine protease
MNCRQFRTISPGTAIFSRSLLLTFACGFIFSGLAMGTPQAGGVPAAGPKVRVVRSVAGTKGETRGGNYVILDPRTTFYVPDDRQVIVYFEWEAPKGTHHCEGSLKGPNGQLVIMSSFDYPATQTKFGGFWTIPLMENTPAGIWTFESRVDGESAGELRFEIISAKRPADAVKEETLPTQAEIYGRAVAASVSIEKLDSRGQPIGAGSGFFLEDGVLVTAFRVIDGAQTLRIALPDGSHLQSTEVLAWNRRQDWALLKLAGAKSAKLRKSESASVTIGDHCYWLDTKPGGGHVISDGQIVGKEAHEGWGERFSISGAFNGAATGGPVLNEGGEVLGLLGGTLPESLVRSVINMNDSQSYSSGGGTLTITGSVVPLGLIRADGPGQTPLQNLWSSGQFTAPVTATRNVSFGMITQGKPQKGKGPLSRETKVDFSRQDEIATIVIAFQGIEGWKSTVQLRIYDVDNHVLTNGDPVKISLRPGETQERIWSFPLTPMHPGVFRADVLVGDAVAWREYFRVRD